MQDRMRKTLMQEGVFEPDIVQLEDIKSRLETAHKLFCEYIAKHGCEHQKTAAVEKRKSRE
jgi:hypothetical protein